MMKNLLFLPATAISCFLLASCSSNDFTEPTCTVQVEQSETSFDAAGGTRTIKLCSDTPVQATVGASWATVSVTGSTVTVTAQMNSSRESRHTSVTLTAANGDKTVVGISQEGMIFVVRSGDIVVDDAAQHKTIEVRHTLPVSIIGCPDWLTANVGNETIDLDFANNTTGYIRSAYVKYQSGESVDSFKVRQGEQKDILGFYYMYFKSAPSQSDVHWTPTLITQDEIVLQEGVQRIRYTFDPATLSMRLQSGQLVGTTELVSGGTAYFYLSFLDKTGSAWSAYRTDISATLTFDYRADWGNYTMTGGKFGTNDISGFTFRMYNDNTLDADTDSGLGIDHYAVTFLKWRKGTVSSDHPEVFSWQDIMNEWKFE